MTAAEGVPPQKWNEILPRLWMPTASVSIAGSVPIYLWANRYPAVIGIVVSCGLVVNVAMYLAHARRSVVSGQLRGVRKAGYSPSFIWVVLAFLSRLVTRHRLVWGIVKVVLLAVIVAPFLDSLRLALHHFWRDGMLAIYPLLAELVYGIFWILILSSFFLIIEWWLDTTRTTHAIAARRAAVLLNANEAIIAHRMRKVSALASRVAGKKTVVSKSEAFDFVASPKAQTDVILEQFYFLVRSWRTSANGGDDKQGIRVTLIDMENLQTPRLIATMPREWRYSEGQDDWADIAGRWSWHETVKSGRPVVIADLEEWSVARNISRGHPSSGSTVTIPIADPNSGRVALVLCCWSRTPHEFDDEWLASARPLLESVVGRLQLELCMSIILANVSEDAPKNEALHKRSLQRITENETEMDSNIAHLKRSAADVVLPKEYDTPSGRLLIHFHEVLASVSRN